jgi:hypothetical protein
MDDLKSKIFFFAVAIFLVRIIAGHFYDPTIYRGQWYSVKILEGWSKEVKDDEVFFKSPEKDFLGNPEAIFSIYGFQSRGALFMDLFMPEVFESLAKQDGKVLQHGEVKIDEVVADWILFKNNDPKWIIWTFYAIDDHNRLTKIQMMAKPENFDKYRPVFEQFKDTIRFKKIG